MRNMLNVAVYESKTLYRSWFFRIFSLLSLLILFGMNTGLFGDSNARWTTRAIAANMPYINVLIMNVAQAVIAVFLASDFLRRDKKLDTTEVIYARPITNGEYVVGKTLGILVLFVGLVLLALAMSLIFNLAIKDVPVVWEAYLLYPLLITLPTLIFILGLSFFLMILFRSQAVTFLILLGYIGLTLAYFRGKVYGLLDYMAFNLPMVYSDFIHFANPGAILLHRMAYLLMGTGFIFATIRFMNRLPQTGRWNQINLLAFAGFLLAGCALGMRYYSMHHEPALKRQQYLHLNDAYSGRNVADIISDDLNIEKQGEKVVVSSAIRLRNGNQGPIDTLIFSLNPGFTVDSVTGRNGLLEFLRREQLLLVVPESPLDPGRRGGLSIYYHGIPDPGVANLDIPDDQLNLLKKVELAVLDKEPGILKDNYLLMTPELIWYPVAGVRFNRVNFNSGEMDFATFSLTVDPGDGLVPVAPGRMEYKEGLYHFTPENDMNSIPLVIAPLEKRSLEVDGVTYSLYMKPGHDYFSGYFTNITDTLGALIKQAKDDYELDELDLYLEFSRVNLVEVPIQYHAYERPYTQNTDYVFPEIILLPEKGAGLNTLDFRRFKKAAERRDRERERERSPKEMESDMVIRFLQSTFFSTETRTGERGFGGFGSEEGEPLVTFNGTAYSANPFNVFPLYYNYVTGISTTEFPAFNSMMEIYLKEGFEVSPRQGFTGGITDNERANLALKEKSMLEIFTMGKSQLTSSLIYQTGSFIFSALRNRVGMGDFDNFLYYYLEDHTFQEIPFNRFEDDFRYEFGVEIRPYLEMIHSAGRMATFLISDPEFIQTRDELGDVYLVKFRISNKGNARGIVDITFRIMGQGSFGGGGGGMSTEQRLYEIDAGVTREVQVALYDRPMMMTVNTLISGNIPSSYNIFLRAAEEKSSVADLSEYQRNSDHPVSLAYENEFVVDNEDAGFSCSAVSRESKLKQYIDKHKGGEEEITYGTLSQYMSHSKWHPVSHSSFYGETVRSALCSSKGDGDNKATWKVLLPETGFYDVYVYIPVSAMFSRPRGRPRQEGGQVLVRGSMTGVPTTIIHYPPMREARR